MVVKQVNNYFAFQRSRFNILISKQRFVIECTVGGMFRWFGADLTRYKAIKKVYAQHVMKAIA